MEAGAGEEAGTELSRSLIALRRRSGLRQVEVAASTGLSQAQLSRVERGWSLPTEDEVDRLARLYEAEPAERDRLLGMVIDARAGVRDSRLVVQRGNTLAMQQRWRRIEGGSRVVRSYQPALVLGVLQVPEYAAVVLQEPVGAPVVRDRAARHERLLDERAREHLLIQTEGSLRLRVGSIAVMERQMQSVLEVSRRPNVRLGVIPQDVPVDIVAGTAFHLYDDAAVVVGLEIAAATLTDPADTRHFRRLFDRLTQAAAWDDVGRRVVERILADLRADAGRT